MTTPLPYDVNQNGYSPENQARVKSLSQKSESFDDTDRV